MLSEHLYRVFLSHKSNIKTHDNNRKLETKGERDEKEVENRKKIGYQQLSMD